MINCIAIDDEPLALRQVENYVKQTPFLRIVGSFTAATDAIDMLNNDPIDVIFIDINMPDINGLDFVKSFSDPPLIVFTTAYSEYAVESYKVNALDYLLKPFSYEDFLRTAMKIQHALGMQRNEEPQADFLFIRADNQLMRIDFDDIIYIEGMSEYIRIFLTNRKPLMVFLSMKKIENALPSNQFVRIHRSFIVNYKHIESLTRVSVTLKNSPSLLNNHLELPISSMYRSVLNSYVNQHLVERNKSKREEIDPEE